MVRPASPARVLRAVRHLSGSHDLFSPCVQLKPSRSRKRIRWFIYTSGTGHLKCENAHDVHTRVWNILIYIRKWYPKDNEGRTGVQQSSAFIACSFMHTNRMIRLRPVDWVFLSKHAEIADIVRSRVDSQVKLVLSVRERNKNRGETIWGPGNLLVMAQQSNKSKLIRSLCVNEAPRDAETHKHTE